MGTIGEEATNYVAPQKLNIADLDVVEKAWPLKTIEKTKLNTTTNEEEPYSYLAYVDGTKEYYIAGSVLDQMKAILKLKPTVTKFNVTKSGAGFQTKYKVEALD